MAKKIKVVVEQGLKIDKQYQPIGAEISIEGKEAKRLLALGTVSLPQPKVEEEAESAPPAGKGAKGNKGGKQPSDDQAALIEKIKAAGTQEELEKLVEGHEQNQTVVAAASERLEAILAEGK